MPRPHGLPRWAFLALACAAFFAVAMIPRGVVRTIEASHLRDAVADQVDLIRLESPAQHELHLPGVRALVAREEQDLADVASTPVADVPGGAGVHDVDGAPTERRHDPRPVDPQLTAAPSGSRAPPPSI